MFPRMCREGVVQAPEKVHERVACAWKVRGMGGLKFVIYRSIHRWDRRLDRVPHGGGVQYTNISLTYLKKCKNSSYKKRGGGRPPKFGGAY